MKIYIFFNGCKGILHDIMGHHPLPIMSAMKKVNIHGFERLAMNAM
jgi:hypothetical protein